MTHIEDVQRALAAAVHENNELRAENARLKAATGGALSDGLTRLPAGIAWLNEGGRVTGKVLVVHPNGRRQHVATVRYGCAEDAAHASIHLIDALRGAK